MTSQAEQDPAATVEIAAVRLLSIREHSRHELRRKLRARRHDSDLIERVLDDLECRNLLSDARFVESYVTARSRKGYGPLRIRAELTERGVAMDVVGDWLDRGEIDWSELLADVAGRKFGDRPADDLRDLTRRARFLEQRGFPVSLVRRYLDRRRPS